MSTTDAPRPSAKTAGKASKRGSMAPAGPSTVAATPSAATAPAQSPQATSGVQTRKRVLPSRSRRGGPGVGTCDVDVMILETRQRRSESEPLIPPSTKFLLTTNAALAPPPVQGEHAAYEVNSSAYGRYFDRPEVQEACRAQALIQTPEYTQLPDDALVGGRFRPRGTGEEIADTSDAAYEKRHRKYETFEKRQRLREKEKLKHEQYKLKERIEQLRGMDTAAFLALPASNFSEPPGTMHEDEDEEMDIGLMELPGAHVNGAAAYNEGERRRREMLEIAEGLEERYRILLPPDRKWLEKKEKLKKERESASLALSAEPEPQEVSDSEPEPVVEAESEPEVSEEDEEQKDGQEEGAEDESDEVDEEEADEEDEGEDDEEDEEEEVDDVAEEDEEETIPPAAPSPASRKQMDTDGESEVDVEVRDRERSKKLKLRIKFPPRPTPLPPLPPPSPGTAKKIHHNATHTTSTLSADGRVVTVKRSNLIRGPNGKFLPKDQRTAELVTSVSYAGPNASSHPRKRRRTTSAVTAGDAPSTTTKHSTSGGGRKPPECVLMVAARRNAIAATSRKTQRNVTAFGVRVPQEIEEVRDFELPIWMRESTVATEGGNEHLENHTNEHGVDVPAEALASWDEDTKDEYPEDDAPDD